MVGPVAVEPDLTQVRSALEARGYAVTTLVAASVPRDAIAYVVSGGDQNLLGMQQVEGRRAPVIVAAGLSTAEVVRELERRVGTP